MWVLVPGSFMFLSAVFVKFSLVEVDWEGRLGVLVRNLRTMT